jgi:hypothetical protein
MKKLSLKVPHTANDLSWSYTWVCLTPKPVSSQECFHSFPPRSICSNLSPESFQSCALNVKRKSRCLAVVAGFHREGKRQKQAEKPAQVSAVHSIRPLLMGRAMEGNRHPEPDFTWECEKNSPALREISFT